MKSKKYKSIADITSFSMLLILLLCTALSIFSKLIFTSMNKDAEIINLAGSLRTQSYRIAYDIKANNAQNKDTFIDQYEAVLYSDSLKTVTSWHSTDEITHTYFQVVRQWEGLKEKINSDREDEALAVIANFVDIIDDMVRDIQLHSECKLNYLITASCMGITLVGLIMCYIIRYINKKVVAPIVQLAEASQNIRQGNFEIELDYQLNNEIGLLSTTFRRMADKVSDIYSGLEQSISHHNDALELAVEENILLSKLSIVLLNTEPCRNKLESALSLILDMEAITAVTLEWNDKDSGDLLIVTQGGECNEGSYTLPLVYKGVNAGTLHYQSEIRLSLLETVAPIFAKYLHSIRAV